MCIQYSIVFSSFFLFFRRSNPGIPSISLILTYTYIRCFVYVETTEEALGCVSTYCSSSARTAIQNNELASFSRVIYIYTFLCFLDAACRCTGLPLLLLVLLRLAVAIGLPLLLLDVVVFRRMSSAAAVL